MNTDLAKQLKDQGFTDLAIQRLLTKKERLNIPDNDPLFQLLLELESYLALYQHIPETIEKASTAAAKKAQQQAELALKNGLTEIAEQVAIEATRLSRTQANILATQSRIVDVAFLLLLVTIPLCFASLFLEVTPAFVHDALTHIPAGLAPWLVLLFYVPTGMTVCALLVSVVIWKGMCLIWQVRQSTPKRLDDAQ